MENAEHGVNKDLILREKLALQRTILANQATLLAFIRTALYFLVAGFSVHQLLDLRYSIYLEITLFCIASILFVYGTINFFKQRKNIQLSEMHIGNYKLDYTKK